MIGLRTYNGGNSKDGSSRNNPREQLQGRYMYVCIYIGVEMARLDISQLVNSLYSDNPPCSPKKRDGKKTKITKEKNKENETVRTDRWKLSTHGRLAVAAEWWKSFTLQLDRLEMIQTSEATGTDPNSIKRFSAQLAPLNPQQFREAYSLDGRCHTMTPTDS